MAAGLGFKDFTTGEVLTAADVDGYLMQGVWVFASAAARDAAVTSPQEGNFAYLKDTNVTTYYTGSAWANLDTTGMTNPMTTTGDTIYSSSGSTPARLGIGSTGQVLTVAGGIPSWATPAGGSTFVGCSISNTNTSVSISNATNTKVAMNTETFDTDGFHDNSTNNTRITIPSGKAGKYLINGSTFFAGNATGERTAYIFKNNAEVKATFTVPNASANCNVFVTAVLDLAVADYVEFVIRQNSGGALNSQWETGQYGWFDATYLGA